MANGQWSTYFRTIDFTDFVKSSLLVVFLLNSLTRHSPFENQPPTPLLITIQKKICIDPCHRSISRNYSGRVADAVSAEPRKTVDVKAIFIYGNQETTLLSYAFQKKICIDPCHRSIFAAERWQSGRLR